MVSNEAVLVENTINSITGTASFETTVLQKRLNVVFFTVFAW